MPSKTQSKKSLCSGVFSALELLEVEKHTLRSGVWVPPLQEFTMHELGASTNAWRAPRNMKYQIRYK